MSTERQVASPARKSVGKIIPVGIFIPLLLACASARDQGDANYNAQRVRRTSNPDQVRSCEKIATLERESVLTEQGQLAGIVGAKGDPREFTVLEPAGGGVREVYYCPGK